MSELRSVVLHQSLIRPILLGGAERELALLNGVIAVGLIFGIGSWQAAVLGVIWAVFVHWGLVQLANRDTQFFDIYKRHVAYQDYYMSPTRTITRRRRHKPRRLRSSSITASKGLSMLAMKEFRTHLKGLPDLLNYGAMIDNGIILNKDGSFTTAFYFRGQDLASSTNEELAAVSTQVNSALVKMGTGWMLHIDSIRIPATSYPAANRSFFPDATTLAIEEERRAQHGQEGAHFVNVYAMALTYLVPPDLQSKIAAVFVDDDSQAANSKKEMNYSLLLNRFKGNVTDIVGSFSARLQLRQMNSDELLTYLNGCLTGVNHDVKMPAIPMYLDAILGNKDFYTGLAPRIGNKHIRVVTIFGFPGDSQPGILDMLNRQAIEYRWSTRFISLDPRDAEKRLNVYRRNWFQKRHGLLGLLKSAAGGGEQTWGNSDAVRMAVDADMAVNENSEGLVRYGFYTAVLVIMANDAKSADENAREISKTLGNSGFPSFVEDINAVEAFLGSLPGHGFQNVRRPLMHTLNLADLLPLTASICCR